MRRNLTPREVWEAIAVSKQAAAKLMKPPLDAGLVRRVGSQKSGRYILGCSRSAPAATRFSLRTQILLRVH
jgi:hypothetical protein